MSADPQHALTAFNSRRILVVGDVMLDKYVKGAVDRISPEAPVPVVNVLSENFVPGGAANTAANIRTLGGHAILIGIIGNDPAGDAFLNTIDKLEISPAHMVRNSSWRTIQKIRIVGQNQQLLRLDYETSATSSPLTLAPIQKHCSSVPKVEAIIISDYAKGTLDETVTKDLIELARSHGIKVIIDPKPEHKNWYRGAFLITPNRSEAEGMVGRRLLCEEDVEWAGKKLRQELDCNVLITLGAEGMLLFQTTGETTSISAQPREVFDVSGAGDSVIATLTMALSANISLLESAKLANIAGGIKVGKLGTAPVWLSELQAATQK
jgi:rfaE bifunctional protein kinase chain/domain